MTVRTVSITETIAPVDEVTAQRHIYVSAGDPVAGTVQVFDVSILDAEITLVAPVGVSVPGGRPTFTVTVDTRTPGLFAEIQWSADQAFTTSPATVQVAAPTGAAATLVAVQAPQVLADGVWWWRARITGGGPPTTWTAPATFAAIAEEGHALIEGTWEVTAATGASPHLWYIDIDATGTQAGQPGVLIGTGFGTAPRVWLGTLPCPVTALTDVPATAAGERIEPGVVCEPWHQRIDFTIPDVGADHVGAAITVTAG